MRLKSDLCATLPDVIALTFDRGSVKSFPISFARITHAQYSNSPNQHEYARILTSPTHARASTIGGPWAMCWPEGGPERKRKGITDITRLS
jgi:hypothetical protein